MRNLIIFAVLALLFAGCADKYAPEPTVIYKDKFVPTKCDAVMPVKPKNDGTFEADKAKMIYYRDCENLLKQCLGIRE